MEEHHGFTGIKRLYFRFDKGRSSSYRQQYSTCKERGQDIGYDGHKKTKGSKIHGVVTFTSLPVSIDLGASNEHESRRLITLLKDIRIKGTRRPRSRPKQVYADTKYNTPLVMMYLTSRGIAARIKERVNSKRKKKRSGRILRLFDYGMYAKITSSIERFYAWMKSFRRIQMRHDRLA